MREEHQAWSEPLLKSRSVLVLLLSMLLNIFSWVTEDSKEKIMQGLPVTRVHLRNANSIYQHPHNDAIITYAVGIDFMGCYRFFYSARIHMPTADILFFTSRATVEGSSEMQEALATFRVTPVYTELMEFPPVMLSGNQHSQIRWVAYQIWMREHEKAVEAGTARPYNTLLFMDTRDAVFQGDVFLGLRELNEGRPAFFAFLEGHGTIGGSEWNYLWIANCLGGEKLSVVAAYPVSCSGTVASSWDDALVFISLFLETLLPRLETTPGCLINGVDQGIFNYLVHSGELASRVKEMVKVPSDEGIIVNAGVSVVVDQDSGGRALTSFGRLALAIHQYDRFPSLSRSFEIMYPWISPQDRRARHRQHGGL